MADHSDDARQIYETAKANNAGRVALRAGEKYVLTRVDLSAIATAIAERSPHQYKLQVRHSGDWVDASRLEPVPSKRTSPDNAELATLTTSELQRVADNDEESLVRSLKTVARQLNDAVSKGRGTAATEPALRFMQRLATVHKSPQSQYLHATVALLDTLVREVDVTRLENAPLEEVVAHVEGRALQGSELFSTNAGEVAASIMLGKMHSMSDRGVAARHFSAAREGDRDGLIGHFYDDLGVQTYYDEPQLSASAELVSSIKESIEPIDAEDPAARTGVVISVDPKFYRIYAPIMYFYAQQMPEVDYNLVMCGDAAEVESALVDGEAYRSSLARLNQSGSPENVHHFRMPVPNAVVERKTFYASARFFAAQFMLERYPSLYLMDADLTTETDPRPFFRRLTKLPFAAVHAKGLWALSPWRRYMAGNVAISREVLGSSLLDDLHVYLARGLGERRSWMLDQNALSFVAEKHPAFVRNVADHKRPFFGPPFRAVWERNYRAR